jgi:hypothetical protein
MVSVELLLQNDIYELYEWEELKLVKSAAHPHTVNAAISVDDRELVIGTIKEDLVGLGYIKEFIYADVIEINTPNNSAIVEFEPVFSMEVILDEDEAEDIKSSMDFGDAVTLTPDNRLVFNGEFLKSAITTSDTINPNSFNYDDIDRLRQNGSIPSDSDIVGTVSMIDGSRSFVIVDFEFNPII